MKTEISSWLMSLSTAVMRLRWVRGVVLHHKLVVHRTVGILVVSSQLNAR